MDRFLALLERLLRREPPGVTLLLYDNHDIFAPLPGETRSLMMLGRLRAGVTFEQGRDQALALAGTFGLDQEASTLGQLAGAVSLVLLIAGANVAVDLRVLGFTIVVTLAVGILSGIVPVVFAGRTDPQAMRTGASSGQSRSVHRALTALVEEGSLYPALYRMEKKGWGRSSWGRSEANRRARYYHLTAAGKRHLERQTRGWARFVEAVAKVIVEA